MSVLGSNAIEVMKKRMQEISHLNEEKNRNSEIRGMPPSYITVKTSYDILPMNLETDEIGNIYKNISRNFCKTDHIYKSVIKVPKFNLHHNSISTYVLEQKISRCNYF